jgi:hypothetical protein
MSSLLFYNVENSKKRKKNPGMGRCVQTFDWYCILYVLAWLKTGLL